MKVVVLFIPITLVKTFVLRIVLILDYIVAHFDLCKTTTLQ